MSTAPTSMPVSAEEFRRRVIDPSEFVADEQAFVDVRLDRSRGKASYSLIGPGVSQNAAQSVSLTEPRCFNFGGASMPHGCVNNPHLHFTAEVFICTRGHWAMRVGEHGEHELIMGPGTIFSVPTWVFRGFENLGDDDGWLFTVLGGDETGGILWAPSVLREAAATGLYLGTDHTLRDADAGDSIEDVVEPLDETQLQWLRPVTDADLQARVVPRESLDWSDRALLSHILPGCSTSLAPVIGAGMTEHRDHRAPITVAHGFSIEWLRVAPGSHVGEHRLVGSQVLILVDGDWDVALNSGPDRTSERPAPGSVVSVPPGAWRDFANIGTVEAHAIVVNEGDAPSRIEWSTDTVDRAREAGWARDAGGFLAPAALIGARS
ncbi:cupin domain-containing protein [soil metagenome]